MLCHIEILVRRVPAMSDAEQPTPELYREAAKRLRQLAAQSPLPDIQGDLLDLAARFERMAVISRRNAGLMKLAVKVETRR
jgi:formate dehydrogenase maturation protein FdhE